MSAFGRPTANGTIDGYSEITATFPDDKTYKGQLVGNDSLGGPTAHNGPRLLILYSI